MEKQPIDKQDTQSIPAVCHNNEIGLPLLALGFDLVPIFLVFLNSILRGLPSYMFLLIVLSPIAGLITGVISLAKGKRRIGLTGKIISIIAIILPLSFVAFIIIFFIGVVTGVISLM